MSGETEQSALEKLYSERFGEPLTPDEVYGYWLFVSSVIVGVIGVGLSLASAEPNSLRAIGIGVTAIGVVGSFTGLIIGQSYRETATYLVYAGLVVSIAAVAWFMIAYPDGWNWSVGNETTAGIFLLYLIGVSLITMSGVMAPIVVGPNRARHKAEKALRETRRSLNEREQELEQRERELREAREEIEAERERVVEAQQEAEAERARALEAQQEAELERERVEEAKKEAEAERKRVEEARKEAQEAKQEALEAQANVDRIYESKGTFQLYEDNAGKWRWRLVHQNSNIVATSGQGYASDRSARRGMRSVKRNALGADVFWDREEGEPEPEPEPVREESKATFELYRGADDKHRWRLRHDNGRIIAAAARGFSSGSTARNNIDSVQTYIAPADYLSFDPAAFEVFEDAAGEYRWRLVHQNGRILGDSGEGYASRSNARRAIETVEQTVEKAEVDAEDGARFEVYEDNAGDYRWRLVSSNDEIVADGGEGFSGRSNANDSVERFQQYTPAADTLTVGDAAIEIYEDNAGDYRWRLRHRNGIIMAKGSRGYSSRSAAVEGINSVKRNGPTAEMEEIEEEDEEAEEAEEDTETEEADETEEDTEADEADETDETGEDEETDEADEDAEADDTEETDEADEDAAADDTEETEEADEDAAADEDGEAGEESEE